MQTGKGQVLELILEDGCRLVRVRCPSSLIPLPGQYVLAAGARDTPLPVSLFHTDFAAEGFVAIGSIPEMWHPGMDLHLRGPLGRGFSLPLAARRVALIALDASPARLRGLIGAALRQNAAVVLVCDTGPDNLPDEVEIQPTSSLEEIVEWSDYAAFDVARENLSRLKQRLAGPDRLSRGKSGVDLRRSEPQILIHTPVPCGGVADCGVCAVSLKSDWKLACKDGPVFDWV